MKADAARAVPGKDRPVAAPARQDGTARQDGGETPRQRLQKMADESLRVRQLARQAESANAGGRATLGQRRRDALGLGRHDLHAGGNAAAGRLPSPAGPHRPGAGPVVQRVIVSDHGDGADAVKQRLGEAGVPGTVVDNYQALITSHSEREVLMAALGARSKKEMWSSFPKLTRTVDNATSAETALIVRGMSIDNVNNLHAATASGDADARIFRVQDPAGTATATEHIVHNADDSRYLSYEARGYDISAAKYAPKPTVPETHKPRGVRRTDAGFLKQRPSYTGETRRRYPEANWIGYFGGINVSDFDTLDVSTPALAEEHLGYDGDDEQAIADRDNARRIAVNDREVLVAPGAQGIRRSDVRLIGRSEKVSKAYFDRKRQRQTGTKALGQFKPAGSAVGKTEYYKIQLPEKYNTGEFALEIPEHDRRTEAGSASDISDVASIDLDLEDGDFSA